MAPAFWAAGLGVALVAAVSAMADEAPKYSGILTYMIPADAPPSFDAHREGTFATVHSAAPFYRVLIRVDLNNPSSTTHFVCEGLAGGGVIAIVELGGGWLMPRKNSSMSDCTQPPPSSTMAMTPPPARPSQTKWVVDDGLFRSTRISTQ